jgi:hypothetical protein
MRLALGTRISAVSDELPLFDVLTFFDARPTEVCVPCLDRVSAGWLRAQPKRIREVDRIPAREPVEVEPSGEPDGIRLG